MGGAKTSVTSEKAKKGEEKNVTFRVDLPQLKLDVHTTNKQLPEIRKIIEALATTNLEEEDDATFYEAKTRLTPEFYAKAKKELQNALVLDDEVRILKRVLPLEQEVNLENGEERTTVNAVKAKEAITNLLGEHPDARIRACTVHVRGRVDAEAEKVVMDSFQQALGLNVKPRFYTTRKNLEGNVLVEALLFGNGFNQQEW